MELLLKGPPHTAYNSAMHFVVRVEGGRGGIVSYIFWHPPPTQSKPKLPQGPPEHTHKFPQEFPKKVNLWFAPAYLGG